MVEGGTHDVVEPPPAQRGMQERGRPYERHRPAPPVGPPGGVGEDRHVIGVGGADRGVVEIHDQRQVSLTVDEVGQHGAKLRGCGQVELAVDGHDDGPLVPADLDAGRDGPGWRREVKGQLERRAHDAQLRRAGVAAAAVAGGTAEANTS